MTALLECVAFIQLWLALFWILINSNYSVSEFQQKKKKKKLSKVCLKTLKQPWRSSPWASRAGKKWQTPTSNKHCQQLPAISLSHTNKCLWHHPMTSSLSLQSWWYHASYDLSRFKSCKKLKYKKTLKGEEEPMKNHSIYNVEANLMFVQLVIIVWKTNRRLFSVPLRTWHNTTTKLSESGIIYSLILIHI